MRQQGILMPLVGSLLLAGLVGCTDKPVPKVDERDPVAEKPEPAVVDSKPVAEKPKPSRLDDPNLRQFVKDKAQECSTAFIEGDYETFVDLTYPELIQKAGGRDKMIAQIKSGVKELTKRFTVRSVEVDVPREVAEAGAYLVAIVPTVTQMDVAGVGERTQRSFLIGISDDEGKTWTFFEGSSYDEESIRKVLPDFPEKLELPKVEMPNIPNTS